MSDTLFRFPAPGPEPITTDLAGWTKIEGNPTRYGFKAEVMDRPVADIVADLGENCSADGDDGAAVLRNHLLVYRKEA